MGSSQFKDKSKKVKVEKVTNEPSITRKRIISSLWNNQAAYDGGRFEKGYIALIMFVLSIVIALVPSMVSVLRVKGGDIYAGNLYHTDVALTKFVEDLNAKDVDIRVVNKDGNLVFTDNKSETNAGFNGAYTNVFALTDSFSTADINYFSYSEPRFIEVRNEQNEVILEEQQYEYLRVYYAADSPTSFILNGASVDAARFLEYKLVNSVKANGDAVTSYIIIGKSTIYSRIYNPNYTTTGGETTGVVSYDGNTKKITEGTSFRNFGLIDVDGESFTSDDLDYTNKVVANFAKLADDAYRGVILSRFWAIIGIYLFIFVLIALVMGLVVFLSTRGKHNPHRDLKFIASFKVGAWLLPTPALITLIAGFIFMSNSQIPQMVFIMSLGMRSVFLSMRTLSPNQPQK